MRAVFIIVMLPLMAGCSDLFKVTNPGPTNSSDLDNPAAAPSIVTGISYELSTGLTTISQQSAVVTRELFWAGSGNKYANNGSASADETDNNWDAGQEARWVAEHGVTRLQTAFGSQYGSQMLSARANLLAGFADRMNGENFCTTVIDGGPKQDRAVSFQRALAYFNAAMHIDSAAGDTSYITAAVAGRASVEAALGNWNAAAADAALVPLGFEYDASYNGSSGLNNLMASDTYDFEEITIDSSLFAADSLDPRTPSASNGDHSQNGVTPFQAQQKFTDDGQGVSLAKGTEMRMLQAEAALLSGDISGEISLLNQARTFYGIATPLAVPPDAATAWAVLRSERGATLWLEGRRLWDLGRWFAATGDEHDDTLNGRAKCLPIGSTEALTNPNI